MARYTPQNVTSGYNVNIINTNFSKIQTAINDTLSRSGDSPNQMNTSLDMNSNRILNLPAPTSGGEPARFADLTAIIYEQGAIPSFTGNAGKYLKVNSGETGLEYSSGTVVSVKDYGAVGDYTTNDTAAINAAISALGAGDTLYFPRGVYSYTGSLSLPAGIIIKGDGAPSLNTYPLSGDDKRYLRPGYKHLLPGSSIIFKGTQTSTATTGRSDSFASFGYAIKTADEYPCQIRDLGIVMDMDVYTAAGVLTTPSTDNRSTYDVGLYVHDATHCIFNNVTVFGYWILAGLLITSQSTGSNPDYNYFHQCTFTGDIGVALVGADAIDGTEEGLSGTTFSQCKLYDRTHHDRTTPNVADLGTHILYIDGYDGTGLQIAGHMFIGCEFRGSVEDPIHLDRCRAVSLMGCTMELVSNALYSPNTTKHITGTSVTEGVKVYGCRWFSIGQRVEELIAAVGGTVIVDDDDDGTFHVAKAGKGVAIGASDQLSNDPYIQLANDFDSALNGWNIRYRISAGDLEFNLAGTTIAEFDSSGNFTCNTRVKSLLSGNTRDNVTIATGAITVPGGSSFIGVDTEASAATDDLTTINGGVVGDIIILTAQSGARTVVCKDGTGNLRLAGDFSLDNQHDTITLMYIADGNWIEISRADNGT